MPTFYNYFILCFIPKILMKFIFFIKNIKMNLIRNLIHTESEIIKLSNERKLRGKKVVCNIKQPNTSSNNNKLNFKTKTIVVNAFLNIPFGKPPIGELRFKVKLFFIL